MEDQRTSLLSWAYFCQGKTIEELRSSLFNTTLELEQIRMIALEELKRKDEELKKRDEQLTQLKDLLNMTTRERDEAQEKCQRFFLEKLLIQQQQQQQQQPQQQQQQLQWQQKQQQRGGAPLSGTSSVEDEPRRGIDSANGFSSSDCEESIVSSPVLDSIQQPQLPPAPPQPLPQQTMELVPEKPLPEKGKLLQAVMKAGPLLQTLILAGQLPQWRHPPPPLETFEIPPVTIPSPPPPPPPQLLHQDALTTINGCNTLNSCGKVNRKRALYDGSEFPTGAKFQRVVLH